MPALFVARKELVVERAWTSGYVGDDDSLLTDPLASPFFASVDELGGGYLLELPTCRPLHLISKLLPTPLPILLY